MPFSIHPSDRVLMTRLLSMITEAENTAASHLMDGMASDWADYKHRVGYVRALGDVRSWCREIAETDDADRPSQAQLPGT